jgi:hypothetical protein
LLTHLGQIIALVLTVRTVSLVPAVDDIHKALECHADPSRFSEYCADDDLLETVHCTMQQWLKAAKEDAGLTTVLAVGSHILKQCPPSLYDRTTHPFSEHPMLLRAVNWSPFPFRLSPQNTTQKNVHNRFTKTFFVECSIMETDLVDLITEQRPRLLDVRRQVEELIQGTPGLDNFELWYQLHDCDAAEPEDDSDPEFTDEHVRQTEQELSEARDRATLTKALQTFANTITRSGLGVPCAVPGADLEESDSVIQLHPDATSLLGNLHKV